jgi:DNA-binding response OmpR family regulator
MSEDIKILYVEDDETLGYITQENLERKGYEVIWAQDGEEGWKSFTGDTFHICILDVMLPILDGFSLAKKIREADVNIPIIFVTAKTLQEDKIEGLMLGADDYIVKPFSLQELMLKIEIFLRRSNAVPYNGMNQEETLMIGAYKLDFNNLVLTDKFSKEYKLTLREAELLKFFNTNKEKLVTREQILEAVWGENDYFFGRSLDVFISRLRKYLKNDPGIIIENRHGVGFIFKVKP